MLEKNFTVFLKEIVDNSEFKNELKEITFKYKDEPELALSKIKNIAEREIAATPESYTIIKEGIKEEYITKVIIEFITFKDGRKIGVTSDRKDENEPPKYFISITIDQIVAQVLECLNKEFLENLYLHTVGNDWDVDFNQDTLPS